MIFMQQLDPFENPKPERATNIEKDYLIEQAGALRFRGLTFEDIGQQIGVSKSQACRYFEDFIESNQKEWLTNKGKTIAELNEQFRFRLAEAEKNYFKAKEKEDMSAAYSWNRTIIETLRTYIDFLKDCGYLNTIETTPTQDKNSPLQILIEANRQKLLEALKAPHESQVTPTPGE